MEDDIAEKLRHENPEQFFILVRMHLSFIIDMNTDENGSPTDKPNKAFKWGFSKKIKTDNGSKNNGAPTKNTETFYLNEENISQIYQLIDILSEDSNVCQEGIFRRTGSLTRQQQLRKLLSTGGIINGENENDQSFSVHDMASVLKGILADTPEPLLLYQHYQAYCHLASTCFSDNQVVTNCETRLLGAIRLLLLLLPALCRKLAQRLLLLLQHAASREDSNRMSPSALATMFTPHIMCPRRLSPEALHSDSQNLAPILSFMITRASQLFTIPPQLATDITAYFTLKEQRRLLSPTGEDLNESVSDRTAAKTVFTFVNRHTTDAVDSSQNGEKNRSSNTTFTDAALAQLYAHIQALPESQNKRRLIKQFNRENGHGTPLQLQRAQKQRSIGQSLKKHIFNKSLMSKTMKKTSLIPDQGFGYQSIAESPSGSKPTEKIEDQRVSEDFKIDEKEQEHTEVDDKNVLIDDKFENIVDTPKHEDVPQIQVTPHIVRRKLENDLIMMSTPKLSSVLMNADVSGSCSTPIYAGNHVMRRGSMSPITKSAQKMPRAMQESIMTPRSRKPVIINCDQLVSSQTGAQEHVINSHDSSSSSSTFMSSSSASIKNDSDFVSTDESCPSKSYCVKYKRFKDKDQSKDETCSYQTDDDLTSKKQRKNQSGRMYSLDQSDTEIVSNKLLEMSDDDQGGALTDPFRQYLLCRSILTKSPVDLSFVSDSEDFCDLDNLSENKITDSLLYCLNGNKPAELSNVSEMNSSDREMLLKNKKDSFDESSEKIIDKENISPKKKRLNGGVEHGTVEIKRIVLTQENNELSECKDFWDYDTHRALRETNL